MSLSSASITETHTFADAMTPLITLSMFFGPGERFKNVFHSRLSGAIFFLLVLGMTFAAVVGVFVRSTIDVWIQFSLYIVPLIALVNGFRIYRSTAFKRLLDRKLGRRSRVKTFQQEDVEHGLWHESQRRSWLRKASFKNCFYPLSLEVYQWVAYLLFHTKYKSDAFAGELHISWFPIDDVTWEVLYAFFWTFAMYFTSFLAYSFILVSRLTVRDVISFMCTFGETPFLPEQPEASGFVKTLNPVTKAVEMFFGFFFLDLFETSQDIVLVYEPDPRPHTPLVGEAEIEAVTRSIDLDPENLYTDSQNSIATVDSRQRSGSIHVPRKAKLSPEDACRCLSNIVANIEGLGTVFQPFIVLLTFFSVANLVTHIGAIVSNLIEFSETHWWTLVRTCIWLLLALRLLWAVASVTRALTRIKAHVDYLRSVGRLEGDYREWDKLFQLVDTFQLGHRTYGFPLTLKQVVSIAAFMNFTFLIALSIIKPKFSGNAI